MLVSTWDRRCCWIRNTNPVKYVGQEEKPLTFHVTHKTSPAHLRDSQDQLKMMTNSKVACMGAFSDAFIRIGENLVPHPYPLPSHSRLLPPHHSFQPLEVRVLSFSGSNPMRPSGVLRLPSVCWVLCCAEALLAQNLGKRYTPV